MLRTVLEPHKEARDEQGFDHRSGTAIKDRFLLVAGETTFNGRCSDSSGAFMTWEYTVDYNRGLDILRFSPPE